MIAIPSRMPPYQTLGDLNLRFGDQEPTNYTRKLDLESATVRVSYRASGSVYTREIFASAPGQVIVIRLTCDRPNRISFRAALSREQDAATKSDGADRIVMDGKAIARDPAHDAEGEAGVRFRAVLTGIVEGGRILTEGSELLVDRANAVTLLLTAATDFRGNSPEQTCDARIKAAWKPYEQLRAEHVTDYQRYFRRVQFQLAGAVPDLPTDERLSRVTAGGSDPLLATLYFQFGRYLSISSSRPGGLPATLQGLWNESLAPSWESKYTININTEMNYWPAEVCRLSEMHEPLFDLVDAARPDGRHVAQALYHAGGFVLHHNTDIWGDAVPIDGVSSGLWPMGGAWLSLHFWDHYDFTRDRDFLVRRAYPVMKEAAQFLLDYMVDDGQGHLVTGPSISPENGYRLANGAVARLCMGPYMDTEIAYALFSRVLESEQILGVNDAFGKRVTAARDRLTPFRIGKHGQLQEWLEDYDEVEPGHRHISHLFARSRFGVRRSWPRPRERRSSGGWLPAAGALDGVAHGSSTFGRDWKKAIGPTRVSACCSPTPRCPICWIRIRPFRSTATSEASPASQRCCSKATQEKSACCRLCPRRGRRDRSMVCARAAPSRWASNGPPAGRRPLLSGPASRAHTESGRPARSEWRG
jgi:alpha-L-fucosidase 2